MGEVEQLVLGWFHAAARELPWRTTPPDPWAVLVSEVMLQQTPVARVRPVFEGWLSRWPTPVALAAEPAGAAVRAWGRLGYPRRALRLHAAAGVLVNEHSGRVPDDVALLRALPGVGDYTAAAVASFAYGGRHAVLDTNVRRVLARCFEGIAAPGPSVRVSERRRAISLLPAEPAAAARWSAAVMEMGALVCTAVAPRCSSCPLAERCAWRRAGWPASQGATRRSQAYAGTDRQCRGRLLGALREAADPVSGVVLGACWGERAQRERALEGLVADGLVVALGGDRYALPGLSTSSAGLLVSAEAVVSGGAVERAGVTPGSRSPRATPRAALPSVCR